MLRAKRLDDVGVANSKPQRKRVTIPAPECRGHYIRMTPNGTKSYWAVARDTFLNKVQGSCSPPALG